MYDVTIISAIYGDYDSLSPILPQEGLSVDWVFVTDNPPKDSMGWGVIYEPRKGVHPNRAAKRPKLFPWLYSESYSSIWIDGSFRVISSRFAFEAIQYAKPIAQFRHPWRGCLYEEAICTRAIGRYAPQDELIQAQADFYKKNGHPEGWGLWATGIIARYHTKAVREMSLSWMHDIEEWSFQDQVSQAYSLRLAGLYPNLLPGDYFSSPWIEYVGHVHEAHL